MQFLSVMLYIAMALSPFSQQYSAFEWNKKSTLRTDCSIEFPGIVLEPGVYVVKLRESGDRRSFVEILNQDESQVLASVLAVPDHRLRPEGDADFTFHEVKRDRPRPVQSWFYTGDLVGLEFVYSTARAKDIARDSGGHVLASNSIRGGVIIAITSNGKEVELDGQVTQTARRKPQ
jgi:hypothetical protein